MTVLFLPNNKDIWPIVSQTFWLSKDTLISNSNSSCLYLIIDLQSKIKRIDNVMTTNIKKLLKLQIRTNTQRLKFHEINNKESIKY